MVFRRKSFKVKEIIFFFQFFSVIVVLAFVMVVWIADSYVDYKTLEKQKIEDIYERNKIGLKEDMNQFITMIDAFRKTIKNDSLAKEFILNFAEKLRISSSGYIFINRIDGKALVYNGKRVDRDSVYITGLKDKSGNLLYNLEIQYYNDTNGGFINYYFNKLNEKTEKKKISYIYGYKDFEWIIGVGNYYEDLHEQSINFLSYFWKRFLNSAISVFIFFVVITIMMYIISQVLSKRIYSSVVYIKKYLGDRLERHIDKRDRREDVLYIKELDELFAKVDELIDNNYELQEKQRKYSHELKQLVDERTRDLKNKADELAEKNRELERTNDVFVDREYRIKELHERIKELKMEIELLKKQIGDYER